MTGTEIALLLSAAGSLLVGVLSILTNRKGSRDGLLQQREVHELARRAQQFDELQAVAEARASDLRDARAENARLTDENRLLRALTRAQIEAASQDPPEGT